MVKDKIKTKNPIKPFAVFNNKNILRRWFSSRKEAEKYQAKTSWKIIEFKSLIELNEFVFGNKS